MKRLSAIIIIILFSFQSNAQYFDGVKIEGTFNSVTEKFRLKGYSITQKGTDYCQFSGTVGSQPIELWVYCSPKSKMTTKVSIFLPKKESWRSLKSDYTTFKKILETKYGEAPKSYEYFTNPYDEGDGYELQAVSLEKCSYLSFWLDYENCNIMLSISKYKQLQIVYENVSAMKTMVSENEQINSLKF